jgi:hypothetical protein
MKKKAVLLSILLVIVAFGKNLQSQGNGGKPIPYLDNALLPPSTPSLSSGSTPYLTHPEFTNIMTTTVTTPAQNTDEGYIFVGSLSQNYDGPSAVMILDNQGQPIYIKLLPEEHFIGDFRKQTVSGTDYLTYHSGELPGNYTFGTSYVMDQNYQVIDTWTIDNGFGSDVHETLLLDNGNAILMAYVPIPFDLSPYGGPVDGTLIDIVLQEQDPAKNVVFEWVASVHMPIGVTLVNLNAPGPVDFLHCKGIAVDMDGMWVGCGGLFSVVGG